MIKAGYGRSEGVPALLLRLPNLSLGFVLNGKLSDNLFSGHKNLTLADIPLKIEVKLSS